MLDPKGHAQVSGSQQVSVSWTDADLCVVTLSTETFTVKALARLFSTHQRFLVRTRKSCGKQGAWWFLSQEFTACCVFYVGKMFVSAMERNRETSALPSFCALKCQIVTCMWNMVLKQKWRDKAATSREQVHSLLCNPREGSMMFGIFARSLSWQVAEVCLWERHTVLSIKDKHTLWWSMVQLSCCWLEQARMHGQGYVCRCWSSSTYQSLSSCHWYDNSFSGSGSRKNHPEDYRAQVPWKFAHLRTNLNRPTTGSTRLMMSKESASFSGQLRQVSSQQVNVMQDSGSASASSMGKILEDLTNCSIGQTTINVNPNIHPTISLGHKKDDSDDEFDEILKNVNLDIC